MYIFRWHKHRLCSQFVERMSSHRVHFHLVCVWNVVCCEQYFPITWAPFLPSNDVITTIRTPRIATTMSTRWYLRWWNSYGDVNELRCDDSTTPRTRRLRCKVHTKRRMFLFVWTFWDNSSRDWLRLSLDILGVLGVSSPEELVCVCVCVCFLKVIGYDMCLEHQSIFLKKLLLWKSFR